MRAYAIKTKRGYVTGSDISGYGTLINAWLYRTRQQAFEEASGNDIVVPVEIKLIKKRKMK